MTNTWQFSLIFHPHQVIFIHYKWLVVDADDNGKFRLERVKPNKIEFIRSIVIEVDA